MLSHRNQHLMVDCGPGTIAALQEHIPLHALTGLWISHLHPDHSADLLALSNWALNTHDAPRLDVYGLPGWAARLNSMLADGDPGLVARTFRVHELHDHAETDIAGLHLTTRAVEHSVPAFGLRAHSPTAALAYSGDTNPCPAVIDVARDTDLFLCEASAIHPTPAHTTPNQARNLAEQARTRHLMLTHLAPNLDPADALRQATGRIPVSLAEPGTTWTRPTKPS